MVFNYRQDKDGINPLHTHTNELYHSGEHTHIQYIYMHLLYPSYHHLSYFFCYNTDLSEVSDWTKVKMNERDFPKVAILYIV